MEKSYIGNHWVGCYGTFWDLSTQPLDTSDIFKNQAFQTRARNNARM